MSIDVYQSHCASVKSVGYSIFPLSDFQFDIAFPFLQFMHMVLKYVFTNIETPPSNNKKEALPLWRNGKP